MICLDTSAAIKLVRAEDESPILKTWLAERGGTPLVASALLQVELPRALRRSAPDLVEYAIPVMDRIGFYDIDETVRSVAASYSDPMLRSLDAIHLATADVAYRDHLTAFVTYDKRLLAAAEQVGLPVASPGA
ncbi:type II toxin-antitoxin system VapC family toxin [Nocardiopsis synnemataformans]|uniref:type II toxin-antitoxin system VapC family toxin n=1 Tax=Nocardiopsis synnemataformans TaxID=61305 RepID=UPI003EB69CFC